MVIFFKKIIRRFGVRAMLLRERMESGVSFNLLSDKLYRDPYSAYRELREKDPVHRSRLFNGWILTRFADIDMVLRDHRRFSNGTIESVNTEERSEVRSMFYLDPPEHTRLRSLVSQAFTPVSIESLRPRIEMFVDELLDEVEDSEGFDVMAAFAFPLPIMVIADMLGVPPSDRDRFRVWTRDMVETLEPRFREGTPRSRKSWEELREYFSAIIEQRHNEPSDDLISALIAAEEEGDRLSNEELLVMLRVLLIAGNETTKGLIGSGLYALLQHRDQLKLLRESPELVDSAIEEMLRYCSPAQIDGRAVTEDLEIGGKSIRRGQYLILMLGSANRDSNAFANPDEFDVARSSNNHIAFGRGLHHCLAAPLARVECQILFRKLLERFSDMELDGTPEYLDQVVLRSPKILNIRVKRD